MQQPTNRVDGAGLLSLLGRRSTIHQSRRQGGARAGVPFIKYLCLILHPRAIITTINAHKSKLSQNITSWPDFTPVRIASSPSRFLVGTLSAWSFTVEIVHASHSLLSSAYLLVRALERKTFPAQPCGVGTRGVGWVSVVRLLRLLSRGNSFNVRDMFEMLVFLLWPRVLTCEVF